MTTPTRLHTSAVDAAFSHGHVETEAECEARERVWDCVREIALMLDGHTLDMVRAVNQARARLSSDGFDVTMALGHIIDARLVDARVNTLRVALEFAMRSHGRFWVYFVTRRELEAADE